MALRLRGATSGYIELKAPASAGDNTLTLPTNNGSANQLLKTDGSGNLSWTDDNSGVSLSGSTNNTIATVTGANALIGEANLTFDGTQLVVQGGSGTQHLFKHSAGWGGITSAGSAGGSGAGFSLANNYSGTLETKWSIYLDGATDALRFTANTPDQTGDEKLRITSTGKVGIGTTSPSDNLEIASNHSQLRLTDTDDSKFVQFSYSSGKLVTRNNSTNTTTAQFTLDESGRLGIGTISPNQLLHVYNSATDSQCYLHVENNLSRNAAIQFTTTQGSWYVGQGIGADVDRFMVYDSQERFSIDANGHAKIHTGNLEFAAGNGIDFSATGDAPISPSSEILDEYEEGTWAPTLHDASGNNSAFGTVTNANYTRIGDTVRLCMRAVNMSSTGMTAGDAVFVKGLPFNTSQYNYGTAWIRSYNDSNWGADACLVFIVCDNNQIFFKGDNGNNAGVDFTWADVNHNSTDCWFTIVYKT